MANLGGNHDSHRSVIVSLGGRPYPLTGRAAVIAAMVAVLESELNTPRLGEVRFRFANDKVKLIIERHFAEIRTGTADLANCGQSSP